MTRIEIEQYGHTWHAEVEGGTGMTSRRKTVQAFAFADMIAAVVEAWADVNDREPLAILREVGRVMVQRENELMAKRDRVVTYDDLGNEEPPPALRRYPRKPMPHQLEDEVDPEIWGERETQPTSGLGSPGFEPVSPRRGPGRPRREPAES